MLHGIDVWKDDGDIHWPKLGAGGGNAFAIAGTAYGAVHPSRPVPLGILQGLGLLPAQDPFTFSVALLRARYEGQVRQRWQV